MDKTITFRGLPMSYRVAGEGYPVVLLHGFGEAGNIWDRQTEYLQANFRILIPDIPGSGASVYNAQVKSMEDFAEAVKAMVDAEELDEFILIGHSMGGYISLAFAEEFGHLLKGFGLFHSTAFPDTEEKKQTRKKSIAFIQEHGSAEFIANTTPNLFSEWTKKNNPELVKAIIEQYANFDPSALINYTEAMIRRPDRMAVLEKLSVPVLFIIGEEDKAVPMGDMLKQSHIPSIALIHILKDTAHMGMLEQTAISNEALRNFLDRCLDIH